MGSQRRRLPRDERRALILEAAGRSFGANGYDGARLADIADAAGVSKPILYRHFGSKQELYLALLDRHREDLGSFAAEIPDQGSEEERLRAVLEAWLTYVEAHAYSWRMLFRDRGGGPAVAKVRAVVHSRARDVLAAMIGGLSRTSIPERELQPLAELVSMGMASLVLWWLETPTADRESILDAMVRLWKGLLTVDVDRRARAG